MSRDFIQYLEAKQTVDARALNREVAEAMQRYARSCTDLRVLEIGAGHGAMIERFAKTGLLTNSSYTAIDPAAASIESARARFDADGRIGKLRFEVADLYQFAAATSESWDLVVAHAVLDLLDLERAIPVLRSLGTPGGGFYFTINFDGGTWFEPVIDPELDAQIVALYHETMDTRMVGGKRSGHSQTGRRLFGALSQHDAVIDSVGSSDWVVWPKDGTYAGDEAYFLHFIVTTVESALADSPKLEAGRLGDWSRERHAQIDRGKLVYAAHQLDFFGRWPTAPSPRR